MMGLRINTKACMRDDVYALTVIGIGSVTSDILLVVIKWNG